MKSSQWLRIAIIGGLVVAGLLSFSVVQALGTPTLERISAYRYSYDPSISDDGRYIVYTSFPSGYERVLLYDTQTKNTTDLVSGHLPVISGDGNFIAFVSSATDLVTSDTNSADDIFLYNRATGDISRVSIKSDGAQAMGWSNFPSISRDGRYVAFESTADNLGGSGVIDIFIHDNFNGLTLLVSQSTGGAPNYLYARNASISADGRFVVFKSNAWNLVPGDNNDKTDIFLRDLAYNVTARISTYWQGGDSDGDSGTPVISADGRYVAYYSYATNLVAGDVNGFADIFVRDRYLGTTNLVSLGLDGAQANAASGCDDSSYVVRCLGISAHGRYVTFPSWATNFYTGFNTFHNYSNIYVRDRQTSQTTLVSREYFGGAWGENGDDDSQLATVSAGGRYVVFQSEAWLQGNEIGYNSPDVFLYDMGDGTQDLVKIYLPLIKR